MGDTYTHGHHESVMRSHEWRTVENSAGYLIPRLQSGLRLLDVGCGPGTITQDLARLVAPGPVLGIGDVYALDHADASFDIVHAHQVLQHLTDPAAALREMRRVLAPDGTLAVRDADYGAFTWAPADERLDRWNELYHEVTARNGADADAGRSLAQWVRDGGFSDLAVSTDTWTYDDRDSRAWWGALWAERVLARS